MKDARPSVTLLRYLALASCISVSLAGPRYIAIPIDNVDVIELSPISPSALNAVSSNLRLPRHVESYAAPLHHQHHQPSTSGSTSHEPFLTEQTLQVQPASAGRSDRATAHILDYVDFGAHTGPNGAFSWYADYPSHH